MRELKHCITSKRLMNVVQLVSEMLQSLPTAHGSGADSTAAMPFLEGSPNLLVFTFLEGFICNLLQADQLVPSIEGICKIERRTLKGLQSQGSLGQLEAIGSSRRAEQSSCTGVRKADRQLEGKVSNIPF